MNESEKRIVNEETIKIFFEKMGEVVASFKDQPLDVKLPAKTYLKSFGGVIGKDRLHAEVALMLTVDESRAKDFYENLKAYFKTILKAEGTERIYPDEDLR